MKVYYLSPAPFALSNLSLRRIKVSRFADLNDPFELLAAMIVNTEYRQAFNELKQELNETKGLICFSRGWNNPLLWGHYADKHTGIALGFEVRDELLSEVLYTSQRVRIESDPKTKRAVLNEAAVNRLLRTKFVDWKYEEELRVFVQLDPATKESGNYFMDFSDDLALVEVVLGPRCEIPIQKIRALLEPAGSAVKVLKARMAYRTFRVTEDRSYRRTSGA